MERINIYFLQNIILYLCTFSLADDIKVIYIVGDFLNNSIPYNLVNRGSAMITAAINVLTI